MSISVSMQIRNSPSMFISLGSPIRPIPSPNWWFSAHPVRLQSSSSPPSLNYVSISRHSPYRKVFRGFHSSPLLLACALKNGGSEPSSKDTTADEQLQARGESSMPERFRYLCKEAPDRPVRWPWAIALFFIVYAWRTVLWELSNWKKAALAILSSLGWLLKHALAFTFRFIGSPITGLIRCAEFSLYAIKYGYSSIVAFAPVTELTRIILFSSIILANAEATVPDSVNTQPYLLTLAGIIGFGTVMGLVPELPFWVILSGMFFFSRFIMKRDSVSSALPSAALLTAIGEPWVRCIVITSYLALSIAHYAKYSNDVAGTANQASNRRLPLPLFLASLAIGINLAARWIRYRHLTWMIA